MHGGLCKNADVTLEELAKIDRNRQPPDEGNMCDLLWSDPQNLVSLLLARCLVQKLNNLF